VTGGFLTSRPAARLIFLRPRFGVGRLAGGFPLFSREDEVKKYLVICNSERYALGFGRGMDVNQPTGEHVVKLRNLGPFGTWFRLCGRHHWWPTWWKNGHIALDDGRSGYVSVMSDEAHISAPFAA
jgi:hypothetical protein